LFFPLFVCLNMCCSFIFFCTIAFVSLSWYLVHFLYFLSSSSSNFPISFLFLLELILHWQYVQLTIHWHLWETWNFVQNISGCYVFSLVFSMTSLQADVLGLCHFLWSVR
jgi:hypothetical protein